MAPKLLSPQNAPVSNISLTCHHTSTLQPSVRVAVTSALRRTYRVNAERGGSQSANERLVVSECRRSGVLPRGRGCQQDLRGRQRRIDGAFHRRDASNRVLAVREGKVEYD